MIEILSDPFVIITFLIALFAKRLANFGEYIIFNTLSLSKRVGNRIRLARWRYKKGLILSARSYHKVTWSIVRTYAFLILFVLAFVIYLLIAIFLSLTGLPKPIQLFIASPMYVFEVLWLYQKDKAKLLVKIAEERVTSRKILPLRG